MDKFQMDVPPIRIPVASRDGVMTTPWYNALMSLWRRSGGKQDGALEPLADFDAVRLSETPPLWRFSWDFGSATLPPNVDVQETRGVQIRYRLGAWDEWTDLAALHSGYLTAAPWELSTPAPAGVYTFGAFNIGVWGREGDPSIIFSIAPFTTGSLIADDDEMLIVDDDEDHLIDDA